MEKIFILFFIFMACKTPKLENLDCDMKQAVLIANRTVKKAGYPLHLLKYSVEPVDSVFIIHYLPKDINTRGGEAIIKISQNNCKVVQKDLYQ
ncbi:MAG: hypothetical protein RLZZ628_97 [Bacteroidota bacterium]|jgi:hypothetical protein